MSRRPGRAVVAIAMAALLTLSTTAAGSPTKKVSAARWADSVCTAVGDWLSAVKQNSQDVERAAQEAQSSADLSSITASLVSLISSEADATRTAAKAIKDAGSPNAPKGKQAQAALVKGFGKIAVAFDELAARAKRLPSSGASTDILKEMTSLQTESQRRTGDFGKYFGKLDKLDPGHRLKRAFKRAPACRALKS